MSNDANVNSDLQKKKEKKRRPYQTCNYEDTEQSVINICIRILKRQNRNRGLGPILRFRFYSIDILLYSISSDH